MKRITKRRYKKLMNHLYRFLKENDLYVAFNRITIIKGYDSNIDKHRERVNELATLLTPENMIERFFCYTQTLSDNYGEYYEKTIGKNQNILNFMHVQWGEYIKKYGVINKVLK